MRPEAGLRQVAIDCFPESVSRHADAAVITVDVIRATTTAVTAVGLGRRCFFAASREQAQMLKSQLGDALLVGEMRGEMPAGFDMNNSPAGLSARADIERPVVLLSSSGTRLLSEAAATCAFAYVACLRNFSATARHVAARHDRIAIIGAGSRNEFREEDQMCCAWIAEQLVSDGYVAENWQTTEIIERWRGLPPSACSISKSIGYLRRTNQLRDFDFILAHINDLDLTCTVHDDELMSTGVAASWEASMRAA